MILKEVLNIIVTPSATASPPIDQNILKSALNDTIFLNCSVDSSTIVREINKSLTKFVLNTIKITAFASDNASYVCKAYEKFKIISPNSIHITCHLHFFILVAETFLHSFAIVDSFLAKMKSFFKKSRKQIFLKHAVKLCLKHH
jgi:hypothetical protein